MKKLALLACLISFVGLCAVSPKVHAAAPLDTACNSVSTSDKPAICNTTTEDPITGKNGNGIIIKAANLIAIVTGIAAVIIIIVAGLQYITSAGEPNKISGAKQTLIFVAVGLAVVLLARTIVVFIVRRF